MKNIELLLFKKTIEIINYIATGKYEKLSNVGCLELFTKRDIVSALEEYGGAVSVVDENYNGRFRFVQSNDEKTFITFADLIIDNEVSDLTLICEMRLSNDMKKIENAIIEDLHVL